MRRMKQHLGEFAPLLVTARRLKLQWFGYTTRRVGSHSYAWDCKRRKPKSFMARCHQEMDGAFGDEAMGEAMDRLRWRRRTAAPM